MAYEHTYFFDLTEDLSLKIPQPVIDEMELTDEPCLITKPFDDMLSFTKMYGLKFGLLSNSPPTPL